MRTAISVEDALLKEADAVARELGVSRSRLISDALREYLKRRRRAEITRRLDRVYAANPDTEDRRLIRKLRTKMPVREVW